MHRRSVSCATAISTSLLAAVLTLDPIRLLAAGNCTEQPNLTAGQSGHWYYLVDRASGHKCWYQRRQIPIMLQQPSPDAAWLPLSSLFSFLGVGSATASNAQPDAPTGDTRGIPQASRSNAAVPKRRHQANAKSRSKASASLDRTDRDSLFQDYLRWRERQ
jgi:hypothetical protein